MSGYSSGQWNEKKSQPDGPVETSTFFSTSFFKHLKRAISMMTQAAYKWEGRVEKTMPFSEYKAKSQGL